VARGGRSIKAIADVVVGFVVVVFAVSVRFQIRERGGCFTGAAAVADRIVVRRRPRAWRSATARTFMGNVRWLRIFVGRIQGLLNGFRTFSSGFTFGYRHGASSATFTVGALFAATFASTAFTVTPAAATATFTAPAAFAATIGTAAIATAITAAAFFRGALGSVFELGLVVINKIALEESVVDRLVRDSGRAVSANRLVLAGPADCLLFVEFRAQHGSMQRAIPDHGSVRGRETIYFRLALLFALSAARAVVVTIAFHAGHGSAAFFARYVVVIAFGCSFSARDIGAGLVLFAFAAVIIAITSTAAATITPTAFAPAAIITVFAMARPGIVVSEFENPGRSFFTLEIEKNFYHLRGEQSGRMLEQAAHDAARRALLQP
jgi:hypothetical protein